MSPRIGQRQSLRLFIYHGSVLETCGSGTLTGGSYQVDFYTNKNLATHEKVRGKYMNMVDLFTGQS